MPSLHVKLEIHGTYLMYRDGRCRCDKCTTAFMRHVPHGTPSGYTHHKCRCDTCRDARSAFARASYQRTKEAACPA